MPQPIRTILLDIEGTVAPVSYVYDVLFQYARRHLKRFLDDHQSEERVRLALELLRKEHREEKDPVAPRMAGELEMAAEYCDWLMSKDRKSPALKAIQGMIWQEGYLSGELCSEIFADVPVAFQRWRDQGRSIAIYSSGSVLAQQLFFRHSQWGDLTPYISFFFDTNVGPKRVVESYHRITAELQCHPEEILFVSDVIEELDAARGAGIGTVLAVRPGSAVVGGGVTHRLASDLSNLLPAKANEERGI